MADKYKDKAYEARLKRGQRSCEKKKSFANEEIARRHNKGQLPYKCENCGKYHLRSMQIRKSNLGKKSTLNPRVEKDLSRVRHEEQKVKHKQWKSRQKTNSK